jgi:hypothetical protein
MGFSSFLPKPDTAPAAPPPVRSASSGFSAFLRGGPAPTSAPAPSGKAGFSSFLSGKAPVSAPAPALAPARKKAITHDEVMAFRNAYVFGRKEVITPADLRDALQAIHDRFEDRPLYHSVMGGDESGMNAIWAEDLHIPLEWDAVTGHLRVLDPKVPYRESDAKRYRGFAVKDDRYTLPPEARALAQAITAKQQTYRRSIAARQGLTLERFPYTVDASLASIPLAEAIQFGVWPYKDAGGLQYDDKGGPPRWKAPLKLYGKEWVQTDIGGGGTGLVLLQRVVPRSEWSGPTFTDEQHRSMRALHLPAMLQMRTAGKQLERIMKAKVMSYGPPLLPGEILSAGGKPYVATNELRSVVLPPFSTSYYLGEWYRAENGTVFGVVGFVKPSGDEPTLKAGYGKGASKVAADRVYAVFPDDPSTARVHVLRRGDQRVRHMDSMNLGVHAAKQQWLGLPVVSRQALRQVQKKTAGLVLPGIGE